MPHFRENCEIFQNLNSIFEIFKYFLQFLSSFINILNFQKYFQVQLITHVLGAVFQLDQLRQAYTQMQQSMDQLASLGGGAINSGDLSFTAMSATTQASSGGKNLIFSSKLLF